MFFKKMNVMLKFGIVCLYSCVISSVFKKKLLTMSLPFDVRKSLLMFVEKCFQAKLLTLRTKFLLALHFQSIESHL